MRKIFFSDKYGLTKAVLEGRKTMTRRIIKAPKKMDGEEVYGFVIVKRPGSDEVVEVMALNDEEGMINNILPKYKLGEVVAVAQKYSEMNRSTFVSFVCEKGIWKKTENSSGWSNKMFVSADLMPHRIRITNIRVERLQDISDEDCLREGIVEYTCNLYEYRGICYSFVGDKTKMGAHKTPREAFAALIDRVSGNGTWESNPWVFVYEFELVK